MKMSQLALAALIAAGSPTLVLAQTPPTAVSAPADGALDALIAD